MLKQLLSIIFISFFLCFASTTYANKTNPPFPPQISVEILQLPTPLIALGKFYLVYELYVTNFHTTPVTLKAFEVSGPEEKDAIFNYIDKDLEGLIHPIGGSDSGENPFIFQPGITKMIFLWLQYETEPEISDTLIHKFSFEGKIHGKFMDLNFMTDPIKIEKIAPIVIQPPLKGDFWFAGGGPSNTSFHRAANLVVHGHDYFAQRYAIDFIQIGNNGTSYNGNEMKNSSYFCYGKEILSVAAGTVVKVKDGIPENVPHAAKRAVEMTMETIGGNHVVVDIGNGSYAFYAHLIPGSLKVKQGDKVSAGQVLGKIGNSGNSTEPHLHFHIVDKPSFLGGNGLPYAFTGFDVRQSKTIIPDPVKLQILNSELKHYTNEIMLENTLIKFSD